jgi:uncharacterized membrane protein
MNALKMMLANIAGLFVDDEFLALGILVVVAIAALLAKGTANALAAEITLLGGCVAVLVVGVWRSARSQHRG